MSPIPWQKRRGFLNLKKLLIRTYGDTQVWKPVFIHVEDRASMYFAAFCQRQRERVTFLQQIQTCLFPDSVTPLHDKPLKHDTMASNHPKNKITEPKLFHLDIKMCLNEGQDLFLPPFSDKKTMLLGSVVVNILMTI